MLGNKVYSSFACFFRRRLLYLIRLTKALFFLILLNLSFLSSFTLFADPYRKAIETDENVKNKLFPKDGLWEFSGPSFGTILNQSYIDSYLIHFGLTYFTSERWGLSLEGAYAINTDKPERYCIEHFYNDPYEIVGATCLSPGEDPTHDLEVNGLPVKGASFGPAYVPIRELNYLVTGSFIWNPIYGKQLAFLSFTNYFDIFITGGIGATFSTFYPESLHLRNGTISRGPVPNTITGCPSSPGVCPRDPNIDNLIGEGGRPDPISDISPTLTFGIGQKFHFKKRFHIKVEIRNYTLVGTEEGYEPFFALWAGFGFRL
jgi:outer membrane beta-barrel protein